MASTSENKPTAEAQNIEKSNDDEPHVALPKVFIEPQDLEKSMDSHVALPRDYIEKLKNPNNWEEWGSRWNYDEEDIKKVWEWQESMDYDQIMHHVLYGDGEEIVWEHDVFGVQQITQVPEPHATIQAKDEVPEPHDGKAKDVNADKPKDN